jgi:exopolysaccharide production protein ExoZ
MNVSPQRIDGLQVMRALAATFVMMYHGMHMLHRDTGFWFLNKAMVVGYSGVDIFFVISGFIILYTSDFGIFKMAKFLKKRFIRIFPIYWVVNILLLIAYFISPSPDQLFKGKLDVILGSLLLLPQQQYIIGISWTLSYELIFYLIFAITFNVSKKFLFIFLSIWTVIILTTYGLHVKSQYTIIDTLLNPVVIEFILGCFLAYLYKRYPYVKGWYLFLIVGAVGYLVNWNIYYTARLKDDTAFISYISRLYLFGLPVTVFIFGLLYVKRGYPRLLVYLGDASYSLYLIHGTVISALLKLAEKFELRPLLSNNLGACVMFAITISVAMLFYTYVEKPLIAQIRKRIKKSEPQIQVINLS